ncbi:cobalamin B12-binding domain-containing protein [Oleispirillum naphthae]|uniref:cobalamin B12-binding domain-containing protein n=1 Tax=Oleispirillum naphthae TaxID=2838853 RepID=UPI00308258B8
MLISKPGLDGHDRGAKIVARAFEEAGAEVIYTGLQATPEEIAEIAKREEVDVVGVSLLSGAHNSLMPRVIERCKESGVDDGVVYLLGGIIPQEDIPALLAAGVERVFGPGSELGEIVSFTLERVAERSVGEIVSEMGTKSFNL